MTDRQTILKAIQENEQHLERWVWAASEYFKDADEDEAYEMIVWIQNFAGNINSIAAAYTEEMRRIRREKGI